MRTWTLVLSVGAHAVAIGIVIVAPIFAASDLPDPRRPLTFETITPLEIPTVPVTPRSNPAQPSTSAQSIPTTEPKDLPPDIPAVAPLPLTDVVPHGGTGVPTDGFAPVGDPVVAPPQSPARKDPLPVGGLITPPTRVTYVAPAYPQTARAARVEGTVILQAVIDETGSVRQLSVLRGHPLLNDAAMQAVSKWQFTPTLLNGTTVPVVMTVTVSFTLTK